MWEYQYEIEWFLGGHGQENKGIRLKAGDKLWVIKEASGLGFWKLRNFVKQGWRFLNNDNPLITICMQAKYFPDGNFLIAKLGVNPVGNNY